MNSSQLLDKAVEQFTTLPGVGRKTALKYVLSILKKKEKDASTFIETLSKLKTEIRECKRCHNISDNELCQICQDKHRDETTICIVENIKDIISIESTTQYKGLYHVLGGIISPMDGIGPSDLNISNLFIRIEDEPKIKELFFALSATIEGDTTAYYIYKKIPNKENYTISTIAKGISIGCELDYTDELTLGRSIRNRVTFTI